MLRSSLLVLSCVFCLLPNVSFADEADDARFLAAQEAFRTKNKNKLVQAGSINNPALAPYEFFWKLSLNLNNESLEAIKSFLDDHPNTYLAEKLRSDWLRVLGQKGNWRVFDAEYALLPQPEQDLQCFALQSKQAKNDSTLNNEINKLWLELVEPPAACSGVFDAASTWKADDVWARIRRQFEANKTNAAKQSLRYFIGDAKNTAPDLTAFNAVIDKPLPYLIKLNLSNKTRSERELIALSISRVARNDPSMASMQLMKFADVLESPEKNWAWNFIGYQAAQRHQTDALTYFQKAQKIALSKEVAEWKVRAALRAENWKVVRATIEAMSDNLAADPAWIYWLARALEQEGKTTEAQNLYTKISGSPNFYSNLADEKLGKAVLIPPKAAPITKEEADKARRNPSFVRALELFRLDLRTDAVREWNFGLRNLNDRDLLAAAGFSLFNKIYDRTISAADRTKTEHDFSLRYLSPFLDEVSVAAVKQNLEPAWVFGLIRQESRFITGAKSNVGASGLMQLMPATAKYVAKKAGIKDYQHAQVNHPEINLLLGTSYMRLVSDSVDKHPAVVSAAYNAGPGRAKRWRNDKEMDAAIYAESIPFNETRDYVKKVISNTLYYQMLLDGKPHKISEWLPMVSGNASANLSVGDLP